MPTGPKGEKCPADVIGNAVKVMRDRVPYNERRPHSALGYLTPAQYAARGEGTPLRSMASCLACSPALENPPLLNPVPQRWRLTLAADRESMRAVQPYSEPLQGAAERISPRTSSPAHAAPQTRPDRAVSRLRPQWRRALR